MVFNKTLTVITHDGNNHNFDDVGVKGAATTAYNQYMAHQTIHSYIQNGSEYVEVFIPYSSIMDVFIGKDDRNTTFCDTNCTEDCPRIDCGLLRWLTIKGEGPTFDEVEDGKTFTWPAGIAGNHGVEIICVYNNQMPVVPTWTSDLPGVTIAPETHSGIQNVMAIRSENAGTAHIVFDYEGCKLHITVEFYNG